jgi:hypothetical protein
VKARLKCDDNTKTDLVEVDFKGGNYTGKCSRKICTDINSPIQLLVTREIF